MVINRPIVMRDCFYEKLLSHLLRDFQKPSYFEKVAFVEL